MSSTFVAPALVVGLVIIALSVTSAPQRARAMSPAAAPPGPLRDRAPMSDVAAPAPMVVPTFRNPLKVDIADPHILKSGDTYYLYGTNAPREGFGVATSTDLVNWSDRGLVFRKTKTSWGRKHFWAPCVVEHQGSFYLFYNAVGKVGGNRYSHRICVAKADSPLGPFVDVAAPLLETGQAVIDAHVFTDDDGSPYLYFSLDCSENVVSEVCVVPLSRDLSSVVGPVTRCVRPDQDWEGDKWNEAPFVFRHGEAYVLMYSGKGFFDPGYSVGYATAPTPLGPWTKSPTPLLERNVDVSGPGHNCVIESPDGSELFLAYHTHKDLRGGAPRQLAIDRLSITGHTPSTIRLTTPGPTVTAQAMPAGVPMPALAAMSD